MRWVRLSCFRSNWDFFFLEASLIALINSFWYPKVVNFHFKKAEVFFLILSSKTRSTLNANLLMVLLSEITSSIVGRMRRLAKYFLWNSRILSVFWKTFFDLFSARVRRVHLRKWFFLLARYSIRTRSIPVRASKSQAWEFEEENEEFQFS